MGVKPFCIGWGVRHPPRMVAGERWACEAWWGRDRHLPPHRSRRLASARPGNDRKSRIDLLFGKGHLPVTVPAGVRPTVIRKGALPKLADPTRRHRRRARQADRRAARWRSWRGAGSSACILICDITRPVPNRLFLRPLIETHGGGRHARAAHHGPGRDRPASPERGRRARRTGRRSLGAGNVRVENHFARDDAAHVDLGRTATRGTPVKLDRRFVEAELRIATGLVEPHFMAGWSGGRKVVAPGVAASRHDPHLPLRPLHGGSARGPVQSRRQSAARGAARDRAHARRRATRSTR